jgi:hypothetical protein
MSHKDTVERLWLRPSWLPIEAERTGQAEARIPGGPGERSRERDLSWAEDMLVVHSLEGPVHRRWDWRKGGWVEGTPCLAVGLAVVGTLSNSDGRQGLKAILYSPE